MIKLRTGAAVAAFAAAVGFASAHAACFTTAERQAAGVRQIHSDFMVAALHCRHRSVDDLTSSYNEYVKRFTPEIVANTEVLKRYFKRRYGAGYLSAFDSYVTSLANDGARTANFAGPDFCARQRAALQAILAGDASHLRAAANGVELRVMDALTCSTTKAMTASANEKPASLAETSPQAE